AALAAAENLPGGDAFRPGDILRAANGKTIEVINTDAEGRLVLADGLWYVRREGATHVLDLATLTGAMELALGDLYAGGFANDDEWRDLVIDAGRHRLRRPAHRRARRAARLNFELSDEQELIRRTVREFAETKVAPVAEELDREARFPYELVAELGELGLMGLPIPEEYGGAG